MAASIAELERELQANPRSKRFFDLASEYMKLGRLGEAESLCERGLAAFPNHAGARLLLARLSLGKGDLEKARTGVQRALMVLPDSVPANHLAAEIYQALGDRDLSLKHLRIVELFEPSTPGIRERILELTAPMARPAGGEVRPAEPAAVPPPDVLPADVPATGPPQDSRPYRSPEPESAAAPPIPPGTSLKEGVLGEEPPADAAVEWSGLMGDAEAEGLLIPEAEAGIPEEEPPSPSPQEITASPQAPEETPTLPLEPGDIFGVRKARHPKPDQEVDSLNTLTLAKLYEQQGYPDKAVEVYQRLLIRNPDDAGILTRIRSLKTRPGPDGGRGVASEDSRKSDRARRVQVLRDWLHLIREERHV